MFSVAGEAEPAFFFVAGDPNRHKEQAQRAVGREDQSTAQEKLFKTNQKERIKTGNRETDDHHQRTSSSTPSSLRIDLTWPYQSSRTPSVKDLWCVQASRSLRWPLRSILTRRLCETAAGHSPSPPLFRFSHHSSRLTICFVRPTTAVPSLPPLQHPSRHSPPFSLVTADCSPLLHFFHCSSSPSGRPLLLHILHHKPADHCRSSVSLSIPSTSPLCHSLHFTPSFLHHSS